MSAPRGMKGRARGGGNRTTEDPAAPSSRLPEGSSISLRPRGHPTGTQQGPPPPQANDRSLGLPIDVEVIDDDVLMLPSSRGFPQSRNQSRRNHPVTVVLDEDVEVNLGRSGGINTEEPVATFSLNTGNKRERIPPSRTIINCETYLHLLDDCDTKKKSAVRSHPEPEKVVPMEPTFSCPVCMNPLVEAASTICGHVFCQSCITASVQARKRCPICMTKLKMSSFHRVYLPSADRGD